MQKVIPDGVNVEWLRGLIGSAAPNRVKAARLLPTFNGAPQPLTLEFQLSATRAIGIDLKTDSAFAASLRAGLMPWCGAN
jgi:hypothetical protein